MQRLVIAQRKDRETCKNRPDELREEQFSKIFSSAANRSLGFMSLTTTANYRNFPFVHRISLLQNNRLGHFFFKSIVNVSKSIVNVSKLKKFNFVSIFFVAELG